MNLAAHLIRKGASRILAAREMDRIRREHDDFVRTAKLGVTYYTVKPYGIYDDFTGRTVHTPHTFAKPGRGIHAGQLITTAGTPSWAIWFDSGPLTAKRLPTGADRRAEDEANFASFSLRAQKEVTAQVEAEIRALYPASAELLAAA